MGGLTSGRRRSTAGPTLLVIAIATAVGASVAGCGVVPLLPAPPPIDHLDPGATPPPGGRALIERVALAEDASTLMLEFTGGPPYDRDDPCSAAYVGWAAVDEADTDLIHALVADVTPQAAIGDGVACDAVGHPRVVRIRLAAPFAGERLVDDSDRVDGTTWFVRPPAALATVPALPDGWALGHEESLPESPGGRWSRTYVAPGVGTDTRSGPGTLRFVQGFGQATGMNGESEERDVQVNGTPAVVWHDSASGELVLVWRLGADGMGIVANDADVSVAELIRLAEGVAAP